MADVVVRGGTVVDGTGRAPFTADVRVRGGMITEVGAGLAPDGEQEIDARGALVTPGFIDSHTHYDLEMFWDPTFDPLPLYGVTSTVMGNCGFGIAPVRPDVKADIADLLCFVEELPTTLTTSFPWGWPTWSSYFADAAKLPVTVTPFAFVAHNALRATVLGREAWERHATDDEVRAMCALLDDALRAGALGMSGNWFDTDRSRALVPSRMSDDRELDALCTVLASHPGAILQTIIRDDAQRLHVHRRAHKLGVPVFSLGDGTGGGRDDGVLGVTHLGGGGEPAQPRLGFEASIATAAVPAWHELVNGPAAPKLALLADESWRARARHDWDHPLDEQNSFRNEQLDDFILSDPEDGPGPRGVTLAAHARERGLHPSDALADWVLENGIGSRYMKRNAGRMSSAEREEQDRRFFRRDDMIFGGTDAGAHLKMFCGAGSHLYLLTHWVREVGELTIEQAVQFLTQRTAAFFGLGNRGVLAPGMQGDCNVFALDEIELRGLERTYDLPEGDYRFTRPSAGFRATIVGGVPTVLGGVATGARPTAMAAARAEAVR